MIAASAESERVRKMAILFENYKQLLEESHSL